MLKVLTILGTRPELIKMSRVIAVFDQHTHHVLVHTGQNYDETLNKIFFDQLDIRKPDYMLDVPGANASRTIAKTIEKVDEVLEIENPDAVLVYGDTNSCFGALAAKRRKIPIFHMEAGNRCFDQRVPEEINRKIIDHISDVNLVLTEHARRYLLAEGLPADRIMKTGSHLPEVLAYHQDNIQKSLILQTLNITPQKYFIVSSHREENVDSPKRLHEFNEMLHKLAETYGLPVIVSTHPRTKKRMQDQEFSQKTEHIRFLPSFGFLDYIQLQQNALCVLSDSGSLTEEASLLNLPAVALRDVHERPEGMDEGTLILCGLTPTDVLEAVQVTIAQHKNPLNTLKIVPDYEGGPVSTKILRIVLSYTRMINQRVWMKEA